MATFQDLDVSSTEEENGFKISGFMFDGTPFNVFAPPENHLVIKKQNLTTHLVNGVSWNSNAWLRVELIGQQKGNEKCSIELPFPDLVYGKRIVVHTDMLKPPHFFKGSESVKKKVKKA